MDNYCEAGKVFLFDKLSMKWIFTMCSAECSAHVPFQKNFVCLLFLQESVMLKLVSRNMRGVQNSVIFFLHRTRKCNCQKPLAAIVQKQAEFESKILLQTFVWIREKCGIFQIAKSGNTFTYFPSQGKTVKKPLFRLAKVLKLWSFDRTICPNFR